MKSLAEVEELVGLTRRQIQEYERQGLAIKPTHKNKMGYLLYGEEEIKRLWLLKFYNQLGFRTTDIRSYYEKTDDIESVLNKQIDDMRKQIKEWQRTQVFLEEMRNEKTTPEKFFDELFDPLDCVGMVPYSLFVAVVSSMLNGQDEYELLWDDEAHFMELFSSEEMEECLERAFVIMDLSDQNERTDSEGVQGNIKGMFQCVSKKMMKSTALFEYFSNYVLKESDLDEKYKSFLSEAIHYYCTNNSDNQIFVELRDTINDLAEICKVYGGYKTESAINKADKIYKILKSMPLFSKRRRDSMFASIGVAFTDVFDEEAICGQYDLMTLSKMRECLDNYRLANNLLYVF